jgi:hypothetical protein
MSVIDDVRLSAFNLEPEPAESWKAPEIVLWYAFRELYRDYRDGKTRKAEAEKVKAEIIKRYQVQKTEYDTMKNIVRHQAEMWNRIEIAGSRYGTERTIENADAFFEAVYDVKLKETKMGGENECTDSL